MSVEYTNERSKVSTPPAFTKIKTTKRAAGEVQHINNDSLSGIEIASGSIPGQSLVHKFGRNDNVPNGSWVFVSLTGMTGFGLAAATAVRVKAGGNAADTATTGAGARTIVVQGIAADGSEQQETISLAGASASAPTTLTFWRVHRAWVATVGTYGVANTANIVVESTGGVALITISLGEGQTQKAAFTIPIGKTGYLLSAHVTVSTNKEANVRCFTRADIMDTTAPMASKRLKLFWDGLSNGFAYKPFTPELEIPALSDIWFEAYGDGAVSQVSVDFELLLVDD